MFCKIFARGSGRASGIDYLMGEVGCRPDGSLPKRSDADYARFIRDPPAEVLRGDVELTKALIAAVPFAQKYTSGVLSFAEAPMAVSASQIQAVMDSFEDMVTAGIGKERVNILWVMHADKGRLELNWVIPNVDLVTQKRFAPYYHRADLKRFRAWERYENARHGFADPSDPARKRMFSLPATLPPGKAEQHRVIGDVLVAMVSQGLISCRDEVIAKLEAAGYRISRRGRDYLSIEDGDGQKLRLKGVMYEERFRSLESLAGSIRADADHDREHRERRIDKLRQDLEHELKRRRDYLAQRNQAAADLGWRGDQGSVMDLRLDYGDSGPDVRGVLHRAGGNDLDGVAGGILRHADHSAEVGRTADSPSGDPRCEVDSLQAGGWQPTSLSAAGEIADGRGGVIPDGIDRAVIAGFDAARSALDESVERLERTIADHGCQLSWFAAASGSLGRASGRLGYRVGALAERREREQFRREIDLVAFAVDLGYVPVRQQVDLAGVVLHKGADTIRISQDELGRFEYVCLGNREDAGDIVDFMQRKRRIQMAEIRRVLGHRLHAVIAAGHTISGGRSL